MSQEWDCLPLLPLRCVLEHLSAEDALAAMSTCRHWRSGLLLYQGHKDTLKLRAKSLDKNMFLTKLFRKYVKNLHIYLDCNEEQLDRLLNYVLPQYFDAVNLQEILFIGPSYMQLNHHVTVKLKRIITESLVFKHMHSLKNLAFLGCELAGKNENEKYSHRHVEYYSRPLPPSHSPSADAILTRCDVNTMMYSSLQHIIVDYEQISTEAIESLANLKMLSNLSLNVFGKRHLILRPVQWLRLNEAFGGRLNVAVNIISLPYRKFNDVIENVLVDGLPLVSLKVMFCKTIHVPLLEHLVRVYRQTLQELVWADCPAKSEGRSILCRQTNYDACEVNPFMMLCWQCTNLRRLAVHGYWVWQYDVVGFVRLRRSLRQLEVSSVCERGGRLPRRGRRVLAADPPPHRKHVLPASESQPAPALHPALRARSTPAQRAAYVRLELSAALDAAPAQG